MAENLAYLPQVDAVADGSEDVASGKYYYVYDYIPIGANETEEIANAKLDSNYQTDGVLYNWYAAMDGATSSILAPSGVQGVCPSGWHLPSDAEWTILNDYVDANNGSDGIGNSLKATTGWNVYSGVTATDQFGFSALPAGTAQRWGLLLPWQLRPTGGVPQSTVRRVPTIATCTITVETSIRAAAVSPMGLVCVA